MKSKSCDLKLEDFREDYNFMKLIILKMLEEEEWAVSLAHGINFLKHIVLNRNIQVL